MHIFSYSSEKPFILGDFIKRFPDEDFLVEADRENMWVFYRNDDSTTPFIILYYPDKKEYLLFMERLACFEDYLFLPHLCDALADYFELPVEEREIPDASNIFDEEWAQDEIGQEIAYLKALLSQGFRYKFNFGAEEDFYVDLDTLRQFGVGLTSSTPRIYGYIQYALRHGFLKTTSEDQEQIPDIEVDVPQHTSIAKVESRMTDGSVTFESYAAEDVMMLLSIAQQVEEEKKDVEGVVLNDIGTLYQEGIGVPKNAAKAARWYKRAIEAGDHLYAPSNLGDTYRKGGKGLRVSLKKAFEAYLEGDDPYSHYRIGQAFEEGWLGVVDMVSAYQWYKRAAQEGHYLAIRRLDTSDIIKS